MNCLRLIILIFVISTCNLRAQDNHIIAGVYNSSMTYYDIEPDSVLPYGEYPASESQYAIDLNFDNKIDYTFINTGHEGMGGGRYGVWINPTNNNQVNYYRIDSVYAGNNSYQYFRISIPYEYGDTINGSYLYTSDRGYLYYDYWFDGWDGFSIPEWRNQSDRYLGIQMIINDTIVYGWIRLSIETNWSWPKTIIKEYALSKLFEPTTIYNNNIEKDIIIYPNPVKDILQIRLASVSNHSDISIFDLKGKNQYSKSFENSDLIIINTTNLQSGVYIIRAKTEDKIYNLKMVKK